MTQVSPQGVPNLINETADVSSDRSLSLPETLSLPSTPSISQTSIPPLITSFPTNLDESYREHSTNNIPLRFVALTPLFG